MCILVIRSWPCGHSRCTSTDICMNALSQPGMQPTACSHASHVFPKEDINWPCPICSGRQNWRYLNSIVTPAPEQETFESQQVQTHGQRSLKQSQQARLGEHRRRVEERQKAVGALKGDHEMARQSADKAEELRKWQEQLVHDRDKMLLSASPSPATMEQLNGVSSASPIRNTANRDRRASEQRTHDGMSMSSASPESIGNMPITPLVSSEPAGLTFWPESDRQRRASPGRDYGFPIVAKRGSSERRSHGGRATVDVSNMSNESFHGRSHC